MRLLRDMVHLNEFSTNKNLDALPEDVMNELKKNIRTGAKEIQQKWVNSLELLYKAFSVAGVQRPTPDMKNAWKQYEELIQFTVEQLSKYRGLDNSWRMSSHIFHESLEPVLKFKVRLAAYDASTTYVTEAKSLAELIDYIEENDPGDYDTKVKVAPDHMSAHMQFYKHSVKIKYRVDIEQIGMGNSSL